MDRSIIKAIVFGVLFGAFAYAAPFFVLKAVFFFGFLFALFRFFGGRRRWGHPHGYPLAFVENIRNMSEEDYSKFRSWYSWGAPQHDEVRKKEDIN